MGVVQVDIGNFCAYPEGSADGQLTASLTDSRMPAVSPLMGHDVGYR
jgi:hypothetical protein